MAEFLYQRDIYGQTLIELGVQNKDIIVLDCDLSSSTRTSLFAKKFPDRFFNFGVAEQNMFSTAAGLASCGKIVFCSTFAMFAATRALDQIRNTICYNNFNVKIVCSHSGITVGEDGSSHQVLEDIAIMRTIPNMKIIVPCDGPETKDAVITAANMQGPFYIRLGRPKFPTIEGKKNFQFGKGYVLREGKDVTIVTCGIMVKQALDSAQILEREKISVGVINMHTIKPLDSELILKKAREIKGIVVCEEHSVIGGLASAIDEVLSEEFPKKVIRVGIRDRFGQSGPAEDLLKEYNLTSQDIIEAIHKIL